MWKIAEACGYTLLHLTGACGKRPFWFNPLGSTMGVSLPHPSPPHPLHAATPPSHIHHTNHSLQHVNAGRMWASVATATLKLQ